MDKAHFHSRCAEKHLKKRRFDLAIEHQKKTVDFLNFAIKDSVIAKNIECLKLQRDYHEKCQDIILMKKLQFLHEIMMQRERIKSSERENSLNKDVKGTTDNEANIVAAVDCGVEPYSAVVGEDRRVIEDLPPLELPKFDFGNLEMSIRD
ncbi:hypothetical protein Bhyg_14636 [Pseudolycoriella hygida]|uniref:Nuclear receptor-binding factor 2 MIT domain-containing protein n=1 Tax=Pseudolycoriella hygida TaxID=35572 RepID=A0A9Q0MSA4_9DIPT|nr:hypothetical protein Bhyg_14636 [Pseudolycoriella hygida]